MRAGPTFRMLLLFGALFGLFMAVGWLLGGLGLFGGPWASMAIFLVFALGMNFAMFWWSDRFVLWSYRAKVIARRDDHPRLWDAVAKAAREAGMPMPRVAIVPMAAPNAFATGRSRKRAVVAATEGILRMLDDEELDGVLAHEIAHVSNRDMLVATVAATVAGAIMFVVRMMFWNALFGGDDREAGPGAFVIGLLVAIVAGLAALMIQFAVSRSREFKADATGARVSGKPHALASALEKMERHAHAQPLSEKQVNPGAASLFIVNPFRRGGMARLLSTHPPAEERIRRLRGMP
jgi:heat shock protein HtpX